MKDRDIATLKSLIARHEQRAAFYRRLLDLKRGQAPTAPLPSAPKKGKAILPMPARPLRETLPLPDGHKERVATVISEAGPKSIGALAAATGLTVPQIEDAVSCGWFERESGKVHLTGQAYSEFLRK